MKTNSAFNGNHIEYQSKGGKDKNLSPKEYLDLIRPYLSDIINDHKTPQNLRVHSSNETQFEEWKIQLTMSIDFISSKDSDETRNMNTKSDNIEIKMGSETNDIVEEVYESLLQKHQERLEESMRGNEFVPDSIDLLYYHLKEIGLKRGRSYIDSQIWLKHKKAIINSKNNDDNCFQYALIVALNYQNIKNNTERIWKIKPFNDQYNWKEIDFPSEQKDWKKFELNNKKLLLMFCLYHTILKK